MAGGCCVRCVVSSCTFYNTDCSFVYASYGNIICKQCKVVDCNFKSGFMRPMKSKIKFIEYNGLYGGI